MGNVSASPYTEDDVPGPLGVYGESKLVGEHLVQAASARHFILRTCGLIVVAWTLGSGARRREFSDVPENARGEHADVE